MKNAILTISIALNAILVCMLLYTTMMGCAEIANGKIGVLKKDLHIGVFGTNKELFTLPKGLVVRDASASGADWFEPHRFRIVVTSDDPNLIDYENTEVPTPSADTKELYSADVKRNR